MSLVPVLGYLGILFILWIVLIVVRGRLNPLCFLFGHDMVRTNKKELTINSGTWFWVRCGRSHCNYLEAKEKK